MPIRIQRKRTKGWKMPEGAVCVSRPGKFGNPFSVLPNMRPGAGVGGGLGYRAVPTVEDAIECFRIFLAERPDLMQLVHTELRGKDLACWCRPDQPCHADVLLELANGEDKQNG